MFFFLQMPLVCYLVSPFKLLIVLETHDLSAIQSLTLLFWSVKPPLRRTPIIYPYFYFSFQRGGPHQRADHRGDAQAHRAQRDRADQRPQALQHRQCLRSQECCLSASLDS